MGGGTISLLRMRLEVGADKEVDGHGRADDDDERANPRLRQALRIMRRKKTAADSTQRHHRALLPRNSSSGNKRESTHAIDDPPEHDFKRVLGVPFRYPSPP